MPGVTFADTFDETSDVNLTSHTPTPGPGTGYTQVLITGTTVLKVYSATDEVSASASAAGNGQLVKIAPAPTLAEYNVEYAVNVVDTGTATRPFGAHARISDSSATNYYRSRHLPTGHTSPDSELMVMNGTTKTSLGTVDAGIVAIQSYTLEIRNGSQRLLKEGVAILSASDTSITAAGDIGYSMGQVKTGDTGNIASTYRLDNFVVTEFGVSAATATAAAGVATVSATGTAVGVSASSATAAAGVATTSAVGRSTAASSATAAAAAASVSAAAQSTAASTASSAAGVATVSAVGRSTSASTSSAAAGVATVASAGSSRAASTATAAAGLSSAQANCSASVASSAVSAVGSATVAALGSSYAATQAAAAAGAATVSASGVGLVAGGSSAVAAQGVASVSATASSSAASTLSAAQGTATASAQGASRAAAQASAAAGVATVSATGSTVVSGGSTATPAAGSALVSATARAFFTVVPLPALGLAVVSAVGSTAEAQPIVGVVHASMSARRPGAQLSAYTARGSLVGTTSGAVLGAQVPLTGVSASTIDVELDAVA